jgi:hypothetical protein
MEMHSLLYSKALTTSLSHDLSCLLEAGNMLICTAIIAQFGNELHCILEE